MKCSDVYKRIIHHEQIGYTPGMHMYHWKKWERSVAPDSQKLSWHYWWGLGLLEPGQVDTAKLLCSVSHKHFHRTLMSDKATVWPWRSNKISDCFTINAEPRQNHKHCLNIKSDRIFLYAG